MAAKLGFRCGLGAVSQEEYGQPDMFIWVGLLFFCVLFGFLKLGLV